MTTAVRRAKRRPAKLPAESAVYLGSVMAGEILPRRGRFVARLASGRRLAGAFTTEQAAMRAITSAALADRAPSPTISEKA